MITKNKKENRYYIQPVPKKAKNKATEIIGMSQKDRIGANLAQY